MVYSFEDEGQKSSLDDVSLFSKFHAQLAPQSTYIYREPQCMSPRRNWDSPNPSPPTECALPPRTKGWGAHSPAAKGVGRGGPIPTTGEKAQHSAYSVASSIQLILALQHIFIQIKQA